MTKQWLPTLVSGRLVFALLLTALLAVLVRQRRSLELLAAIVLPFPFLYALSGYTWYLDEPRYLGLLAPLLDLLTAALLTDLRLAALALAAATTLSVIGLYRARDIRAFVYGDAPTTVAPAVRTFDRHAITRAKADYWIAFGSHS